MTALREVLFPHAPLAGAVTASGHISGDLHAPALSNFDLSVDDGDRLRLTIGGAVANVLSREGLDLRVEATSRDPTVTRYLLGDTIPTAARS